MNASATSSDISPDAVAPSAASALRSQRDAVLRSTDGLMSRHIDSLLAGRPSKLSISQLNELLAYRQSLRDLPDLAGFPAVYLPVVPDFIGA